MGQICPFFSTISVFFDFHAVLVIFKKKKRPPLDDDAPPPGGPRGNTWSQGILKSLYGFSACWDKYVHFLVRFRCFSIFMQYLSFSRKKAPPLDDAAPTQRGGAAAAAPLPEDPVGIHGRFWCRFKIESDSGARFKNPTLPPPRGKP